MFEGSMHVPEGSFDTWLEAAGAQQQRLDHRRSHQLLHRSAVERARARAVSRIRSHGLPARRQGARQDQRPARRRQEREAPERRQPAVRAGVHRAAGDAVSRRASLQLVDDRIDGGSHRGELRRRRAVLPHLLRAQQRQPGDRRRHRDRRHPEAGREMVLRDPARQARAALARADAGARRREEEDDHRSRAAAAPLPGAGTRRRS